MRVGELRKALEGVADDVPVVAIPKGGQALSDRIPANHAFCVGDRTDSYVGAFAIEIAMTVPENPRAGLFCGCGNPRHTVSGECINCGGKL